ncbi:MAG: PadR family transcriptional regulator [Bacteroidetes bacterium]|nr:PadR family transcriptional regulator [Bacteroidota bacterium]MCZ6758073.1 PadR family transcriptional regulator [Bacteroidota bacterium]
MKHLSRADEILMLSIACLGKKAYSTSILKEMAGRGGKKVTVGSLWVSLDQLTEKGYVRKRQAEGESRHGGRPRIYYRLTPKGTRMLSRMREFQKDLWKGVPNLNTYDFG